MIEVAAAIIENERGQVLIARRGPEKSLAGMWEFPGGKLEPGESPEDCLKRELQEEMRITIDPYEHVAVNEHDYGTVRIRLIAYRARFVNGQITLTDHDEYRWAAPSELREYRWAPADVPIVERYLSRRFYSP